MWNPRTGIPFGMNISSESTRAMEKNGRAWRLYEAMLLKAPKKEVLAMLKKVCQEWDSDQEEISPES